MHRVNLSFTDEEWREMKRFCHGHRPYQREGTTIKEILLHRVTSCNTVLRGVPCPSPARAHEQLPPEEKERSNTPPVESHAAPSRADEVAAAIRDCEWYGAKLPKGATPETIAAALTGAYKLATAAEVRAASLWLTNHPTQRKTQLGVYLQGWMGRAGKGPTYKPTHQSRDTQRAQADWTNAPDNQPPLTKEVKAKDLFVGLPKGRPGGRK